MFENIRSEKISSARSVSKRTVCVFALLWMGAGGSSFLCGQDFTAPLLEANIYAGGTRYNSLANNHGLYKLNLTDGGLVGGRFDINFAPHFALETNYSYGENNIRLYPYPTGISPLVYPPIPNQVPLGSRTSIIAEELMFYFTGPTHRFRPFIEAGPGAYWFIPTQKAKSFVTNPNNAYLNGQGLNTSLEFGFRYGLGFKWYWMRWFGLRFDAGGNSVEEPHFKLAGTYAPGTVYIPANRNWGLLWEATGGIFFGFGGHKEKPVPPPPPTPPAPAPPPPKPEPTLTLAGESRTMDAGCPGDTTNAITVTARATPSLEGHKASYRWTVNGQPAGENSPTFQFTPPRSSGTYRIGVTASDDATGAADTRTAAPVTREMLVVTVKDYRAPGLSGSASPSEINLGDKSTITLTPNANDCNKQLTYACRAPEGTVSSSAPFVFDSTGVAFDMSDRSKPQSKTVQISCTVTDSAGGTGSATVPVTVNLPAVLQATRVDDIVFPAGNARVNNCGKHILLEEVYPLLTQHPDWDLVVVGHTARGERSTVRASNLARERALNVIATLSGGTDTCPNLELSRIKIAVAGAEQTSDPRPAFCGTSARNKSKEKRGYDISESDPNAKFRRVEIYLVPRGAAIPDAASHLEVVPEADVKARGCPK